MATCLITGASGFLGGHLARLLLDSEGPDDVVAAGRSLPQEFPEHRFLRVDLEDRPGVMAVVAGAAPRLVFHLAGITPPGDPDAFYRGNTFATIHLLDALRASGRACRVVLVGSAAELGPVPEECLPVGEDYPCRPADAYGLSKWLATAAGLAARPPLEVVVARVFNPIGPGLPDSQALGKFAAELAGGSGPVRLMVGDLEARRDFVDVRDVARALLELARGGRPGRIYHVGSGRSERVGDGLECLIRLSGREVTVDVDPALARSKGRSDSRADIGRIVGEVGWSPTIAWEQSIRDLWDEAVSRARAGLTRPGPPV